MTAHDTGGRKWLHRTGLKPARNARHRRESSSDMFRTSLGGFVLLALAGWLPHGEPRQPTLVVTPLVASGTYRLSEPAGWTVSGSGKASYTVRQNNHKTLRSGELDLSAGPQRVEVRLTEPGMVFMTVTPEGGKPSDYGAAVEPEKIGPASPRPADFDAFWERKLTEMRAIPSEPVFKLGESPDPAIEYGTFEMNHVNGTKVYGQYAKPKASDKLPAVLLLQWAGGPYRLDPWWVVTRAQQGYLAFNIQPHNVPATEPDSFYAGLPAAVKNYTQVHQRDRERNSFVEMYLRGCRAVDLITTRPDWDGKTLVLLGTSMGGQQSIAVAGLHPKVSHMIVNVPAGCDIAARPFGRSETYPFYPQDDAKALDVAGYIDGTHFAPNIKAMSLVAMGFVDTVCPPAGIWAAYNLIQGPKRVVPLVDSPHNHLATREQQLPIVLMTEQWMQSIAKGERPPGLDPRGSNGTRVSTVPTSRRVAYRQKPGEKSPGRAPQS